MFCSSCIKLSDLDKKAKNYNKNSTVDEWVTLPADVDGMSASFLKLIIGYIVHLHIS